MTAADSIIEGDFERIPSGALNLVRPLIFFDLETTGTNVTTDRIIEMGLVKVYPDGHMESRLRRINPEMHIPEDSTKVHGITDEDVKGCPTFRQIAKSLKEIFEDCDIAGYNSNKFDVPILIEEFARANVQFELAGRKFIDVQNIFYRMEPRTLTAAYRRFVGRELKDAHSALADTRATIEVLLGQIGTYDELGNDIESLAHYSDNDKNVDLVGRIQYDDNGVEVFSFGKFKGQSVREVLRREPSYYNWMMNGDFPKNTKDVLTQLKFKYMREG